MISFSRVEETALYSADSNTTSGGWWGFVITRELPEGEQLPAGPISLADALTNDVWRGSLVYVGCAPYPDTSPTRKDFLKAVAQFVRDTTNETHGVLLFLESDDPAAVDYRTVTTYMQLVRTSQSVTMIGPGTSVNLTGVNGVNLSLSPTSTLAVGAGGDTIELTNTAQPVATLDGTFAPDVRVSRPFVADLHFDGDARGAFTFALEIGQASLFEKTNWGFQYLVPNTDPPQSSDSGSPAEYLASWQPLAEAGSPGVYREFHAQVNIVNPRNRLGSAAARTVLFFGGDGEPLVSYFRTNFGKKILLSPLAAGGDASVVPAGLAINMGYRLTAVQNGFRFAPVGDFEMSVEGATATDPPYRLLCGLSGTETIAFRSKVGDTAGTRLRFSANQQAYIPQFPLRAASPVGPPVEAGASLLDEKFETSWVSVAPPYAQNATSAHYTAAPKGAELFGLVSADVAPEGLLGPKDPGMGVREDVVFPMVPFAGFEEGEAYQDVTASQMETIAREILSPTRKGCITAPGPVHSASAHADVLEASAAEGGPAPDGLTSTTTPTGFITRYDTSGAWKQLLLAQVVDKTSGAVTRQMGFAGLKQDLQSAFQTSDQFLVVANNADDILGEEVAPDVAKPYFVPPADNDDTSNKFYNSINIGKWDFQSNTGHGNEYGDYRSVMIVKGVKGAMLDIDADTGFPTDKSVLKSPDKWTMKEQFATPDPPDMTQLGPLSDFLVDYCLTAYEKRSDPYFANFAGIVTDPDWTGVLILKADIVGIPPELAGILASVKDPTDFYAHHVGIEIGQIDGTKVEQTDTTSTFGLIYYIDPRYDDADPPHTIEPADLSADYDFTLLTLKALFENSSIKKFDSLAQMVLNKIFGSTVTEMVDEKPSGSEENGDHAVLLIGGVQRNGDAVVYSLASKWPNRYSLANNVLTSVEIDTAQMSTRDDGSKSGEIVSWIGMSGFMNFSIVPAIPDEDPAKSLPAFDIFSFGPDDGDSTALRQGLNYNNLGMQLKVPVKKGDLEVLEPAEVPPPELVEDEIAFNTSSSHARADSIFKSFQLELLGLRSGDANPGEDEKKSDPGSLGFLTAVTQYNLRGVSSGAWHGLVFKLNLGTPGALAGKVNLDSSLLIAWADDSGATGESTLQAMVGIELPGAGSGGDLFSLQTVIKLSIGLIQLMYVPPPDPPKNGEQGGFLLVLNEIALKLLGLLKIPPSGNTAFLLFGDSKATSSTGLGWFAVYNQAKKEAESGSKNELTEKSEG